MAEIRELASVGNKWKKNAAGASESYAEGVKDPKKDWGDNTAAAEKNYETGVQAAISRKAFGKGVKKTGTEGWQKGAVEKGTTRFPQGVAASGDNYVNGFSPYHGVIKNLTLPARGPKGSEANYDRVKKVGMALHAKKISV